MHIIIRGQSPVVELVTPAIGAIGDMCDRSCEQECDIDFVLRKYGDAVSLQRWTNGGLDDYSDVPEDPVERIQWIKDHVELAEQAGIGTRGEIIDADKFNAFFGLSDSKTKIKTAEDKVTAANKEISDLRANITAMQAKYDKLIQAQKLEKTNETTEGK